MYSEAYRVVAYSKTLTGVLLNYPYSLIVYNYSGNVENFDFSQIPSTPTYSLYNQKYQPYKDLPFEYYPNTLFASLYIGQNFNTTYPACSISFGKSVLDISVRLQDGPAISELRQNVNRFQLVYNGEKTYCIYELKDSTLYSFDIVLPVSRLYNWKTPDNIIVTPGRSEINAGERVNYLVSARYKTGLNYETVNITEDCDLGVNTDTLSGLYLSKGKFSVSSNPLGVESASDATPNESTLVIAKYLSWSNSASIYIKKPTDPTVFPTPEPYLPGIGDGTGGGGTGGDISGPLPSLPSDIVGTFDSEPGPSIDVKLPVGASGSDVASSGMYTKYLCNNALLDLLAEFFWEDNIGIQALKAVLGNPIDSIISLTAYPFALETLVPTTATTIYFGQYDSHFSAFSLTKSSFQIDWGTVTIPFFWGSFLDYSPYTKIQLYLPWGVGFVSIDPNEVVPWSSKNSFNKDDFVNGTIRVVTNIELDKGACVHNIIGNNGRIIGSFGGVVGKQVPVTGSDNSARILAMMSAAISSSAAVGMAAGGAVAAGKNLAYGKGMSMAERAEGREMIGNYKSSVGGAIQSLSGGLASPPSYPRAGTFSDATNTLGYQYPYLIISRPSQSVPQQYGRFMGYPSNIFHNHLGDVHGYTEVSSIHLDKIAATANELDELESILKGGVLL